MLEHAVAYATFPNLDKAVAPHAVLEVRTGAGDVVWRFDRDGKRPEQVLSPQVALEMVGMMNSVVMNGTGRRAQLDGISKQPARPARQIHIVMRGSSVTPGISVARCGWETTIIHRPSG